MWSIPATHPTTVPHSSRITVVDTAIVGTPRHLKNFPVRFFGNPYSWTLHQDRQSLSSSPVKKTSYSKSLTASMCRPTRCRCFSRVRARGSFYGLQTSPPASPATDLQAYVPGFLIQHLHHPLLFIFLSDSSVEADLVLKPSVEQWP